MIKLVLFFFSLFPVIFLHAQTANVPSQIAQLTDSGNVLFLIIGAVMVFSMHAGFAFLEAGTVRKKNQVNAFGKILGDWSLSTMMYFLIGFPIAYGISFLKPVDVLLAHRGFNISHFFFLLTFAACIPAIISGGIAERSKFWTQSLAGAILVAFFYPFFEAIIWGRFSSAGFQALLTTWFGVPFKDYAGSVVVHSIGGWIALPAILLMGPRLNRYNPNYNITKPSNLPYLVLGSWILSIGWFGFNVVSAQNYLKISGIVAVNSLLSMVGGILGAMLLSKKDIVFSHNGALAGLIAICAGSNVVHPLSAFVIGFIGAAIFVLGFPIESEKLKIDDVLGVWPLHGIVGSWGGIAAGIFGQKFFGGLGGVNFWAQLLGTAAAIVFALTAGFIVFGGLKLLFGIRLDGHKELIGADLAEHSIEAYPEESL